MKQKIKDYIVIMLGNISLTSAYAFLTLPNKVVNGGVTSTSLLISEILNIKINYVIDILTISLLVFGLVFISKDFFIKSLFSSICYMVFLNFFNSLELVFTTNLLLAVTIGGVLVGIGHYMCLSRDSSTVGYDVIALFLHKKNKKINVALTLRYISVAILIIGLYVFGIKSVIFGILFIFIQTSIMYILTKKYPLK